MASHSRNLDWLKIDLTAALADLPDRLGVWSGAASDDPKVTQKLMSLVWERGEDESASSSNRVDVCVVCA
jgi:hypothetical protein